MFERDRASTSRGEKSLGVGGTGLGLVGVDSSDIFFFHTISCKTPTQIKPPAARSLPSDNIIYTAIILMGY